ncbi:MFS transporter [Seongchinamella sediminis]|uniref:MFS transporter n=1 Tax=Seongchinamella sediminis TaxID=2283635 RepID=A0A3L7DU82_9GAMM|nr:MFS transporter [Seongchinamella sediminis]RLQ21138.1 MFS transporter [Seongchinamella sediminis]
MKDSAENNNVEAEPMWPSPRRAWFMVAVLLVAYISSFIDRQLITLLVDPISQDLQLSDTQFSLLAGAAFSIFYMSMGIPLGWLADRFSRRLLIMWGILIWSLMTVLTGVANTYGKIFAARMGVAVGEAALSPAAFSLIADSFPAEKRGGAIAVYTMGAYIGAGLALIIGGAAVAYIAQLPPIELPLVGALASWQTTFIFVGLPGLLIAATVLLIREPPRRGVLQASPLSNGPDARASKAKEASLLHFLKQRWKPFTLVTLAYSFYGMAPIGYMTWTPTIMIRRFEWTAMQTGLLYGSILLLCSTAGVYAGGRCADWLTRKGKSDASVRTALFSFLLATPFAIAAPVMPESISFTVMLALASFFFGAVQSLPGLSLQLITPNQFRAQVIAIYFMIGNLMAMGIGPTLIALISDYVLQDKGNIALALSLVCAVIMPLSALLMTSTLRYYRNSIDEARAWAEPVVTPPAAAARA